LTLHLCGVRTHSAGDPLDADPPHSEHGRVMEDVQEGDLVGFLARNEYQRV